MASCYVLRSGVSGNCPRCKAPMEGDCHIVSHEVACEISCRGCCLIHGAVVGEWGMAPADISGTQESLF